MQERKTETIDEFAHMIMGEVAKRLGKGYETEVCELLKNNGIYRTAIRIRKMAEEVSPIIYLDRLYSEFCDGNTDIDETVATVMETYEGNHSCSFDESMLMDYEKARKRLCIKLINTEKNRILLEDAPHIDICGDLTAIFFLSYAEGEQMASIIIRNALFDQWNVSVDEAYSVALENTQQLFPGSIKGMMDVMMDFVGDRLDYEDLEDCDSILYVCSNTSYSNGATVICYPGFLKDFAERMGADLYVIPSSIHETLLVPITDSELIDIDNIKDMVKEINKEHVAPVDVLSDNVYVFSRETDKISLA